MNHTTAKSANLREIVVQLFAGSWDSSVNKARALVAANDAASTVVELTRSSGWRERVVAAKVAQAFKLNELIAPLVGSLIDTFAANPEAYTASAFARLLATHESPEREALLSKLRRACPDDSYGRHLLERINRLSSAEPAA